MNILGIDPGYGRCGYGIINKEGNRFSLVEYGCIETKASDAFSFRLHIIHDELIRIVTKFEPQLVGVEELFFSKNTKTAMKVAQARGVILLTMQKADVPLLELNPGQVKQAITGQGGADKRQMQEMVRILLNLKEIPKPDDAADALAIAMAAASWKNFAQA